MARKKKAEVSMPATEEILRAVRLELSEQEHADLRVEAAKQDMSLGALARKAVTEWLKGKGKPK